MLYEVITMKNFFRRAPQLLLNNGPDLLNGKRWDIILQLGEFVEKVGRDKVGPGGEQLAEFDEGRAKFFKNQPQPFRNNFV